MPWTLGLLLTAVMISWILGNLLGALASYYPKNCLIRVVDVLSQAVRPIPYYVMSLLLLITVCLSHPDLPVQRRLPEQARGPS